MSLERELARAEWDARRRRYLALAALLAATAAASFLVLAVVNGLEESIGDELSDTLGGDVRLARGRTGLGDGERIDDVQDALDALRHADPSARFAPRLETQAIFLHGADFVATRSANETARAAAVLVGLDPARDADVVDMDALIVQGRGREALAREWRTPQGERLVPIIVGESFLETGNATVVGDEFSWSAVYNLSAGHVENGDVVRSKAIVVGAYATGFRMIDRLVVYAPHGEVARLLGHFPTDPPASVILASTDDPARLADGAAAAGFTATPADEFRESYLGPVFASVRGAAWLIVLLLALMTAGWMGYTLAHHVEEDRRKIGTLRAVGLSQDVIARTYLLVGGALALGAATAGVAAGALLSLALAPVARAVGLFAPEPSLVEGALLVALSLAAGVVTVRWAVRRAARVSIREALQAP